MIYRPTKRWINLLFTIWTHQDEYYGPQYEYLPDKIYDYIGAHSANILFLISYLDK